MREMVKFAVPEFVSVSGRLQTVFTVTLPKLWLAGETVNCGAELPVEAVSITGFRRARFSIETQGAG